MRRVVVTETAEVAAGTPEELIARIMGGDAAGVAAFFEGLSEKQRRMFVKPLRDHIKTLAWRTVDTVDTADGVERVTWSSLQTRRQTEGPALLAAGAGAISGAVALGKWFRSVQRVTWMRPDQYDGMLQVLTDRGPDWLGELPNALAASTLWFNGGVWRLISGVAGHAGVAAEPTTEFVRAWAAGIGENWGKIPEAMRADRDRHEFVPLMFDDAENDPYFGGWSAFGKAVLELAAEGDLARGPLLDASLGRLLRGGRPGGIGAHLDFWGALAVTDAEAVARISGVISLLSSQNSTVARDFTALVKRLSEAGLIDLDVALEAAGIVVTRAEKNVVRTALGWLDGLAGKHPDRLGEIVDVIATVFSAQAADLQERAVKLVGKRRGRLAAGDIDRLIAQGRVHLAPDMAAALVTALGRTVEPDTAAVAGGYPDVAPFTERPLPPPIASPAELAEEVSALIHRDPEDGLVIERVLAALVEFRHTDRAALRTALEPVVERYAHRTPGFDSGCRITPAAALLQLARAAAGVAETGLPHRAPVGTLWHALRQGSTAGWQNPTNPGDVISLRMVELAAALGGDEPPRALVSAPTAGCGLLDPAVLAARLRAAEAEGWEPLTVDLQQALLRLPADVAGTDAGGFTSKAGQAFADWVAGIRPDLPVPHRQGRQYRAVVDVPRRAEPESLFEIMGQVWDTPGSPHWGVSAWPTAWPAIVPSRGDLVSSAVAGDFAGGWMRREMPPTILALIAETADPVHEVLHAVIADRLVHGGPAMRAGCVDAALVLASRGLLDGARLGRELAPVITAANTGIAKSVPALRDLANAGAARQSWDAVAELLNGVLPPRVPRAVAASGDLLALATELADALAVRGAFPDVEALAAKKGGSAVTTAAKRLTAVLARD